MSTPTAQRRIQAIETDANGKPVVGVTFLFQYAPTQTPSNPATNAWVTIPPDPQKGTTDDSGTALSSYVTLTDGVDYDFQATWVSGPAGYAAPTAPGQALSFQVPVPLTATAVPVVSVVA